MDKQTIGVGGAAVVGVAFGMARYAYGLTLPDVRSEFGLSEPLLGLIASATFAGYLIGLVSVPRLSAGATPPPADPAGGDHDGDQPGIGRARGAGPARDAYVMAADMGGHRPGRRWPRW